MSNKKNKNLELTQPLLLETISRQSSLNSAYTDYTLEETISTQHKKTSISFHPERCRLCCIDRNRKDVITCCQFIIVFLAVGSYFSVQLSQYLDNKANRKDFTLDESVHYMPLPYFYIDFAIDVNSSASNSWNSSNINSDAYGNYNWDWIVAITNDINESNYGADIIHGYHEYNRNTTMKEILDYSNINDTIHVQHIYSSYYQILVIPSNQRMIKVNSKEQMRFELGTFFSWSSNNYNSTNSSLTGIDFISDNVFYYSMNNKEQLKNYDTIGDVMLSMFLKADYLFTKYDIKLSLGLYCISVSLLYI